VGYQALLYPASKTEMNERIANEINKILNLPADLLDVFFNKLIITLNPQGINLFF
jgi:hypothetical protein